MSEYEKNEWFEDVREHPIDGVFLVIAVVAFIAFMGVEFAHAQKAIADDVRWWWSLRLSGILCAMAAVGVSLKVYRTFKRHQQERSHGFEVRQKTENK